MVSVEPYRLRRLLVTASKLSNTEPVAEPERRVITPVPRAITSEKVRTMFVPNMTPVKLSVGESVEIIGAVLSTVLMFVTVVVAASVAASLPTAS
jgi:hypothetical protein